MAEKAIIGIFIMVIMLLSMGGAPTDDLDRQDSVEGGISDEDFNRGDPAADEGGAQGNFNEEQYDCRTEEVWSEEKQEWCDSHIGGESSCYSEDWLFGDEISFREDTYCEPDYYGRESIYADPQIIIIFIIVDGDNFSVFNIEEILDLWRPNADFINLSTPYPCNCMVGSCGCNTSNYTTEYTCDDDPLTDDCYEEETEIHPCNLPNAANCED